MLFIKSASIAYQHEANAKQVTVGKNKQSFILKIDETYAQTEIDNNNNNNRSIVIRDST